MAAENNNKIDNILIASHRVKNIHVQLLYQEAKGQENSPEFMKNLDYLDLAVESLEETIKDQDLNDIELGLTYLTLSNLYNNNENLIFPGEVTYKDTFRNATMLLLKHVESGMKKNFFRYSSILPVNVMLVSEADSPLKAQLFQDLLNAETIIIKDLLMTLIKQIEQFTKNSHDNSLKVTLLKTKYHIAFTYPEIHYELRENNYKTPENIIIDRLNFYLNIQDNSGYNNHIHQFKIEYLAWLIDYSIDKLYESLKKCDLHEVTMNKLLIKSAIINFSFYPVLVEGLKSILKETKENYNSDFAEMIEKLFQEALTEYNGNYIRFKEPSYSLIRKGDIHE